VSPDLDDYRGWYLQIREKTEKEITKLATIDVEEIFRFVDGPQRSLRGPAPPRPYPNDRQKTHRLRSYCQPINVGVQQGEPTEGDPVNGTYPWAIHTTSFQSEPAEQGPGRSTCTWDSHADGRIPFDVISSYEHILLRPFRGTGQLCPSPPWTRLLVHGVPTWDGDSDSTVFGPDALLSETPTLPGLKKAFLAMPPRWLKPVGEIGTPYSTITFAVSNLDGSITKTLLNGRTALFGKEVKVQKWIDKPFLVQCSRCHALGRNKTSRACLGRDSVRCYICGGAHRSEEHDPLTEKIFC
jgi:hypothetical protein